MARQRVVQPIRRPGSRPDEPGRAPGQMPARLGVGGRPSGRWQPVVAHRPLRRPARRLVGQRRWRWPRLHAPRLEARWRRAALPLAVLALSMAGGFWLYRSPLLSIRGVAVEGNAVLSPEAVRGVADLGGRSLIRPDFDAARARLLTLSLVKEAEIGRDWPFGARITIVERAPWGLWQVGGQRYVIDEEGLVLDPDGRSLPAPEGAPVIVQTDMTVPPTPGGRVDPGAVAVARQLVSTAEQTIGRSVVALEFSQASGLTAVFADDLRVVFGDGQGYEFKVAALYAVLQRAQEQGRTLHRVDLRFGDRVALQ